MIMIGQNGKKDNMSDSSNSAFRDVILFDTSSNIEYLKKLLLEKNALVITFDHDAHKILSKNNIQHEISDIYLTSNDLLYIQKRSYELVKWHSDQKILELLKCDDINLGSLIDMEFHYFLLPFLKKFIEISKIFSKYKEKNFISSTSLYDIIYSFTSSASKIEKQEFQDQNFYYDSLKIKFKIKDHYIALSIPKTYYLKLKNITEKFIHFLFNPDNIDASKKKVLVVEFDTLRYRTLLESSLNTKLNLILFARRRPSIWNFQSFSIVKKSTSKVATRYNVDVHEMEKSINSMTSLMQKNLEQLWTKEYYFNSFFSINGLSFWNVIKPIFMDLFNRRAVEFIQEIELTKRLLKKFNPSSILIWTEVPPTEQIVIKLAKKMKIPIVLLQHGLFYDSPGARNMNKFQGVYPLDVDKYVVWGKAEERHAVREGVPQEKIVVLGSPLYDKIHNVKEDYKNDSFILLATSGPVKEDSFDLTIATHERNENTIKKICEVVSKLDKKLVIKLHPSPDEFDPTEIAHKINPEIRIVQTGSITPLIKSCEVLIVIDVSTVILDAQILGKPVISVSVKDSEWGIPTVLSSKSCVVTDADNFENILQRVLNDESFRKEAIANGKKFTHEYVTNIGSASKELLNLLNDI